MRKTIKFDDKIYQIRKNKGTLASWKVPEN